jgi:hypothetical protein
MSTPRPSSAPRSPSTPRPSSALRPPVRAVAPAVLAFALIACASALAAAKPQAGPYSGTTSERGGVTLEVSGGAITHFTAVIGYNGKCGQGGGPDLTASIPRMAISPNGSFGANVRLKLGTLVNDPGRVFGTAHASTVTGTVEQFLHGKPNKCYVETFTAHRS